VFGIDTNLKRRVSEMIVQRPSDKSPVLEATRSSQSSYTPSATPSHSGYSAAVDSSVSSQIRSLLQQGYRIGAEHADKRRFQTSSWTSCPPVQSTRESDVIAAVQACMAEHQGEYVRIFGIDTQSKRRVGEAIVQRPGERSGATAPASAPTSGWSGNGSSSSYSAPPESRSSSNRLSSEAIDQVRNLVRQGYRIGTEHADKRRFQTSSWTSCSPIDSSRESDVLSALEACVASHPGEYIRVFGIDTQSKRRVSEQIIQRP
jgi:carbon dioxide concentrating mechanism protein CcmM